MGVIKGATRSLNYGLYHQPRGQHLFACVCYCGGRGWEQEQGLPDGNHVLLGWRRKPQTVGKAVAQNPQKMIKGNYPTILWGYRYNLQTFGGPGKAHFEAALNLKLGAALS